MALSIKHDEADRLARELARITGETITETVVEALRQRLLKVRGQARASSLAEDLLRIGRRCADLPLLDERTPDEIVGYDDTGTPS